MGDDTFAPTCAAEGTEDIVKWELFGEDKFSPPCATIVLPCCGEETLATTCAVASSAAGTGASVEVTLANDIDGTDDPACEVRRDALGAASCSYSTAHSKKLHRSASGRRHVKNLRPWFSPSFRTVRSDAASPQRHVRTVPSVEADLSCVGDITFIPTYAAGGGTSVEVARDVDDPTCVVDDIGSTSCVGVTGAPVCVDNA